VIERLLETLFRHKLLILLPSVLIPLIVAPIALLSAPSYYESIAGIWVERPTYLTYRSDDNTFLTPAQNQIARLNEVMKTRAFLSDVAKRTSLSSLVGTRGEDRAYELIAKSTLMATSGSHLLVLTARTPSANLSFEIVTGVSEAFKDRAMSDRIEQAELGISFYESRLKSAEETLAKSNEALRRYVASNQRLFGNDSGGGAASRIGLPAAATDPQLSQLMRQADLEQRDVESMRTSLERARLDVSAALEGQELGFQMLDRPQVPTNAIIERRRSLMFPAAGALVGLMLSATLLVLLLASDRSARSEADLLATTRVLGVIPQLRVQGEGRRGYPHGTRRAIGFVAGALPSPSGAQ